MATDGHVRRGLVLEAVATGAFLGLTQVSLGFALLTGAGASSLVFFALLAAWLMGGAVGALGRMRGKGTLALALFAAAASRVVLWRFPFDAAATTAGLVAGAACGAYAGCFLRERAARWGDVRALLLHENNGFVAGILAGSAMLFGSARALDAAAAALGVALLVWRPVTTPRCPHRRDGAGAL